MGKNENKHRKELINHLITEHINTKWWQFNMRYSLNKLIRSLQTKENAIGLNIGLSNLKSKVVKVTQSNTYFVSELSDVRSREVDTREELAINLLKRGFITYEHENGIDHGKETITVKAIINVKK